jgi:hypothetical protein
MGTTSQALGTYQPGTIYHLQVRWIPHRTAGFGVNSPDGQHLSYSIGQPGGSQLFQNPYIDLSIFSAAPRGSQSQAELTNFRLAIPQSIFAVRASDGRLTALSGLLALWLLGYLLTTLLRLRRKARLTVQPYKPRTLWTHKLAILLSGFLVAGLLGIYGLATVVDGHPFDRVSSESWSYIADRFGLGALYDRSSLVPDATVRAGHLPWSSLEFAYPPGIAYFYLATGKAWRLLGGTLMPMHTGPFQGFYKFWLAFFILVDAGLMLMLINRFGWRSPGWSLTLTALFFLNPAVIFDNAAWGQADGLLAGALLASALALESNRPRLGWSFMAVALLLKQSALLAVPILAMYALRRNGARRSLADASFGVIVGYVFMVPILVSGYHPVTAITTILEQLRFFATFGTGVSLDTFSIWTLFAGIVNHLHGWDRIQSYHPLTFPGSGLAYAALGTAALLLVMSGILWKLYRTPRRELSPQLLMLALALAFLTDVTLTTSGSGRYLTLALPFLLLSTALQRPTLRVLSLVLVAIVTVVSLISMYGLFMVIAIRGEWPSFRILGNPQTNPISGALYSVYTTDLSMTLLACSLLAVTSTTAFLFLRRPDAPYASAVSPPAEVPAGGLRARVPIHG